MMVERQALKRQLITDQFRRNAARTSYGSKRAAQQAMDAAEANAGPQLYLNGDVGAASLSDAQVNVRYESGGSSGNEEYKPQIIVAPEAATAATVAAALKAGRSLRLLTRQSGAASCANAGGKLPWVSLGTPVAEGRIQGAPLSVVHATTQLPVGGLTSQSIGSGNDSDAPRATVKVYAKRPTQVSVLKDLDATIQPQWRPLALQKTASQFTGGPMKVAAIQQ